MTNQLWRLAARPTGPITDSLFTFHEEPVPEVKDGQVLIETLYLSLDPTQRVWIERDSYLPAVPIGDVMRGGALGRVLQSANPKIPVGATVQSMTGWQRYAVMDGAAVTVLPQIPGLPLDAHFGLLGHIGLTAYFGLLDVGKAAAGETVVVSTAAGAVGSLVGQIAKIKGCHVVGLTGADDKRDWIKNDLGYDVAINYKTEDVKTALKAACPKGVDVYFDNVGGQTLDIVLGMIKLRGRIACCGAISAYNDASPYGLVNYFNLISRRARMEGFLVTDYMPRAKEAISDLVKWHGEGKLKYRVDAVAGFENTPKALLKLFNGSNAGKLVVKVAE